MDRIKSGIAATLAAGASVAWPGTAIPQDREVESFNLYGAPGLIDMPTAQQSPDALLSITTARIGDSTRNTLSFQITPRLSGSFRYSAIGNFDSPASVDGNYYDRSFDLRYQLVEEGARLPGVVVGLQDFIGTGLYGGEYLVATKNIGPVQVTGGLGWGRLGSYNSISSIGTRPDALLGEGGIPTYDRWFRGPFAAFGGLAWSPSRNLTLKAEYSSDAYTLESTSGRFEHESPWNFGVDYRLANGAQLSAYYAYGSQFGAQISFHTNLRKSAVPGGLDKAAVPVGIRPAAQIGNLGWTTDPARPAAVRKSLTTALERENLVYEGLDLSARSATLRIRNGTYQLESQAIGRAIRVMSRVLPASVEEMTVVPVVDGMGISAVTVRRSDVERLENADAQQMLARTMISDAFGRTPDADAGLYPKFTYQIAPSVKLSAFDPQNPVRADLLIKAGATYQLSPNIELSGGLSKKLTGNIDSIDRGIDSALPNVRTSRKFYSAEDGVTIDSLTASHFGRPATNLYSRVTVGLLEQMYAGVSGEVLWKPVDSRLALGVELNYARQRDYRQLFGLRDYDVMTGHASAYYDLGKGFHGQIDMGRYLAGDWGATVALDREFDNGWRVGAYATFTDVEFEDFGEGSFDKGIRLTIPMAWATGTATRRSNTLTVQSLNRDGGARLNVDGRLYERVRDYHRPELTSEWGGFWR